MDKNKQDPLISNPREERAPWFGNLRVTFAALKPQPGFSPPPRPASVPGKGSSLNGLLGLPLAAAILFAAWMLAYPAALHSPFADKFSDAGAWVYSVSPALMEWIQGRVAPFDWQPAPLMFGVFAVRILAAVIALGSPRAGIGWFWFSLAIEAAVWFGWKRQVTEDAAMIAGVDSLMKAVATGAGFASLVLLPLGSKKPGELNAISTGARSQQNLQPPD